MSYPGLVSASHLTELNDKTAAELPDTGKGKVGKTCRTGSVRLLESVLAEVRTAKAPLNGYHFSNLEKHSKKLHKIPIRNIVFGLHSVAPETMFS